MKKTAKRDVNSSFCVSFEPCGALASLARRRAARADFPATREGLAAATIRPAEALCEEEKHLTNATNKTIPTKYGYLRLLAPFVGLCGLLLELLARAPEVQALEQALAAAFLELRAVTNRANRRHI